MHPPTPYIMTSDKLSVSRWSVSILGIALKYSTYCSGTLPAETNTHCCLIVFQRRKSENPNVALIGDKKKLVLTVGMVLRNHKHTLTVLLSQSQVDSKSIVPLQGSRC